jgi:DGQHR domain-containing protein
VAMGAIPVVRHRQKDYQVYVGHLTADQARDFIFADHYPPAPGRSGYQRPPDKRRAYSFAQYLKEHPAGFMTPILLNARRTVQFRALGPDSDIGHLYLESGAAAAIVDGQHRSLGVLDYLEQGSYPVPFMMFECLPVKTEEQLFVIINREQKRVSMSHVRFVSRRDDPIAELVTRLESDPKSPWFCRVNLVGAKGTKRPVSLQSLRTALEFLLQSGEVKALKPEQQYGIAVGFWRVVSTVWPAAWKAERNSLLTKSLGTLAVAKLGGYLLPQCLTGDRDQVSLDQERLKTFLGRARDVNWMSNGSFQGYAGRHGADLVKNYLDNLIFGQGAG